MTDKGFGRRDFLKGAVVGGAAAAATSGNLPEPAKAQQGSPSAAVGYEFLHNEEAAFVEALVDHMIPADAHVEMAAKKAAGYFSLDLTPQDLHNSDHSSMWGSGATEQGGVTVGDINQGALATGELQGATSAAANVDAFTQSIVLGANIQNNSFTLSVVGHDSTVIDDGDAVRNAFRLVHVMGRQEHGHALGFIEAADMGP